MNNLTIHKLTSEHLDDYIYFFENVAHTDNKKWDRCYCTSFCAVNNSRVLKKANTLDPDVRREFAIDYINKGLLQGYLAYVDNNVVGWMNTNNRNDCLYCYGWKHLIADWRIRKKSKEKIKSVFCFTVAPNMRGQGIATACWKERSRMQNPMVTSLWKLIQTKRIQICIITMLDHWDYIKSFDLSHLQKQN